MLLYICTVGLEQNHFSKSEKKNNEMNFSSSFFLLIFVSLNVVFFFVLIMIEYEREISITPHAVISHIFQTNKLDKRTNISFHAKLDNLLFGAVSNVAIRKSTIFKQISTSIEKQ